MKEAERQALAEALVALADDELILGHRDSEWTGHAPILEEDIAFANIALDEIGHAALWYRLAADLLGEDPETYAHRMVFWREEAGFRNVRLVELPRGDWGLTIVRQYLVDSAEAVRLEALQRSGLAALAQAAAKIAVEERYHLRHVGAWMVRLGRGTEESRRRVQQALDGLWPYAGQLIQPLPGEAALVPSGVLPESAALGHEWESRLRRFVRGAGLVDPQDLLEAGPARDSHTEHLRPLIDEMQSVARLEPEAVW